MLINTRICFGQRYNLKWPQQFIVCTYNSLKCSDIRYINSNRESIKMPMSNLTPTNGAVTLNLANENR